MKKNNEEKYRIMRQATELFYSNGLYKTSMDEIAAELNISKKTIYKYFESKYDLIRESTDYTLKSSVKWVDDILSRKINVASKLALLLENYSKQVCQVSEKWIKDMRTHYPEIWKQIETFRTEKIYDIVKKLIKLGCKEKIITSYPPELIVESYAATLRAIVNPVFLQSCNCTMKDAVDFVFDIHLNGILTAKGRIKYNEEKKKLINK
ncbi:MAG TPA: TetR/AcrR family transcriptional regulator [Ignavibacteria bacterium]|nr:TetR/AcrR family transcriptional regulator [Ignavibacteria bacterium]